jgi:hypothetical protein
MVFNSNGKTYLSQFTYNNVDLETVANYCYLGIVLKFNGNFNLAINILMEKARKLYFRIKKTEISRECNDIIGSAKGSQISETY